MGGDTFIGWSSEGPDAYSSSSAASDRLSFQGQQQLAGLASLATFELAEAPKAGLSRDSGEGSRQYLPMPTKQDLPAALDGTGEARASVPGTNFDVHSKRAPQRSRGAQCEQPPTANHSCQVLPWELVSNGKESGGLGAANADPIAAGALGGTQAVDNGGQDGEGEQEAMQAMESALMEQDSYAAGAGRDSRLHQTDRVSSAGGCMLLRINHGSAQFVNNTRQGERLSMTRVSMGDAEHPALVFLTVVVLTALLNRIQHGTSIWQLRPGPTVH